MTTRIMFTIGDTMYSISTMYILEILACICVMTAIVCSVILVICWVVECVLESYHYERQIEDDREEYFRSLVSSDNGIEKVGR